MRVYAHTGEWEHEVEWRLKGKVALLTKLLVDLKAFIGLKSSVVGPIVSVAGAVAIEFRLKGPLLPLIPCKMSKDKCKLNCQNKTKKMSSLLYSNLLMIEALFLVSFHLLVKVMDLQKW